MKHYMYTAMYLPVDKPRTDGCILINAAGEHFPWEEGSIGWPEEHFKVAELFLVVEQFNKQVIVGVPSPLAKWLKPGMQVKRVDCEHALCISKGPLHTFYSPDSEVNQHVQHLYKPVIRVRCPTCYELH